MNKITEYPKLSDCCSLLDSQIEASKEISIAILNRNKTSFSKRLILITGKQHAAI
jgi:hypothetical protein